MCIGCEWAMPYRTVSRDISVLQQAIRRLRESRCKWLLVVNEVFDIAVNNFDAKKSVRYYKDNYR